VKNWPTFSKFDAKTNTLTSPALKGLGDKDLLKGATIWVEGGFLMGAATPGSLAQAVYDPAAGTLGYPPRSHSHNAVTRIRPPDY